MQGRRLPPLLAVRAFEAAARLGSFSRAAEELGLSQSGISYQVRVLEALVEGPLFSKHGRGVVLTPLGERIAPALTLALDSISKAFAEAQPVDGSILTVSCTQTFGVNWLASRIGGFQLAHPWLAVRVLASNDISDLDAGEADVAIRNSAAPWSGLASDFLLKTPVMPFASPEFLAKYPNAKTPDAIVKLPRTSADDPWWAMWHEQVTGDVPETLIHGQLRFDSQLLDGNAAIAGHGVAMLNPFYWQKDMEEGRLVPVINRWAIAKIDMWFCCLERRKDERKIRHFRAWMKAETEAATASLPRHLEGFTSDIPY